MAHIFLCRKAREEEQKHDRNEEILLAREILEKFELIRNDKPFGVIRNSVIRDGLLECVRNEEFLDLIQQEAIQKIEEESFSAAQAAAQASAKKLLDTYLTSAWWKRALNQKLTQEEEIILEQFFVEEFLICIGDEMIARVEEFDKIASCINCPKRCRGCFKLSKHKKQRCPTCKIFYFCHGCVKQHPECPYFNAAICLKVSSTSKRI